MPKASRSVVKAELIAKELTRQRAERLSAQDGYDQAAEAEVEVEEDETGWQQQQDSRRVQPPSPSSPPPPTPPVLPPPFSTALSEMMLCVGDWPAPQPSSVAVLEPVLAREVTALIRRAADGTVPGRLLDAVHLLWATRRDALFTGRLLRFLELRSLTSAVSADSGEPNPESSERMTLLARCTQFCDEIAAPPPPDEDPEAATRRARLDRLTRVMSPAQYQAFTSVRSVAAQRNKLCRAWVEARWPEGAPPARAAAWHVLPFLLKELVALLVDACMLVRAESGPEPVGLPTKSLAPEHVREAVRRLQMAAPPRADMLLIR